MRIIFQTHLWNSCFFVAMRLLVFSIIPLLNAACADREEFGGKSSNLGAEKHENKMANRIDLSKAFFCNSKKVYLPELNKVREIYTEYAFEPFLYSDGLCPAKYKKDVKDGNWKRGKWGYINRWGEKATPFHFDDADVFHDERAVVQYKGKQGIIDTRGNWIVKPGTFDEFNEYSEGLCAFRKDRYWGFIDSSGKIIFPPKFCSKSLFLGGLARVGVASADAEDGIKSFWIDKTGTIVFEKPKIPENLQMTFSLYCDGFRNKRLCLKFFQKKDFSSWYGFISPKGNLVIKPVYRSAGSFFEGLAPVSMNDRRPVPTSNFSVWQDVYASGKTDNNEIPQWGFINTAGEIVIPLEFEWVGYFVEGRAPYEENGEWGFIDNKGKKIIPAKFLKVTNFRNGYAWVVISKTRHSAIIDKDGKIVYDSGVVYWHF